MYAKLNKKKIPTLQLIALVLVLFQYLVTINDSKNYTSFLALEMLFIYGCLLVTALKKRGLFDLYSLLLCTMGLFSFGEIVFSFFDPSVNYRISSIGYELTFKEETVQNAMLIYSAYLLALDIGIVLYEKRGRNDNVFGVPFDLDVYRAGKMLMILFLAFAFYRAFVQFQILNSNRLLLFQGGSAGLDVPFYLRITSTFFLYGYYIFTASRPPLKQFIVATIVYVLVQIPDLLIGNRMRSEEHTSELQSR